ncbi:MAG: hypothetical protein OK454_08110 [Thaumarchaeota archaeon]|nr:hypothetical protein [Nitrososphaerota archaeon]
MLLPPPALVVLPEVELTPSPWDPEPLAPDVIIIRRPVERTPYVRRTPYETELLIQEINGSKTLLLEIVRRAAYDWILYRDSTRIIQRGLAAQAYEWLFVEGPGHPSWAERMREDKQCMSLIAVCESLDLDPETVRKHVRRLTPKHVMSVGRPAEYRRRDVFSAAAGDDDVYDLPDGLVDYAALEGHDDGGEMY